MRRVQIYLEEEIDEALAALARRQRTSKAALIRQYVAAQIEPSATGADPLDKVVGAYDSEAGPIDETVYGSAKRSPRRPSSRKRSPHR